MKKAIALTIADTHLSDDNHEKVKSVFKQSITLAKTLKLKSIEHLGDLFHSRKAQTQRNLNCLGEIFQMFEEERIDLHIVVGNHDKTEYSISQSFLTTFMHHPNIHIYPYGGTRLIEGTSVFLTYASYFSDDEYTAQLAFLKRKKSKGSKSVLLTHIGVNGAVMNNGTAVETKINSELFDDYNLVLIGHYHDAQRMSDKIFYTGAALQHNFGERPTKGATILYDNLTFETRELEFPKFLAYKIDSKELTLQDIADLKEAAELKGDNLRVILTGSKADINCVDKQRLMTAGIDVAVEQDVIEKEDIEESIVAFTDKAILEAFDGYCKKNKLNTKDGLKYLKPALC